MKKYLKSMRMYVQKHHGEFVLLLVAIAVLDYISKFPYFSAFLLFPYPWNSMVIIWVLIALLFRLGAKFSFGSAFALLCIILILTLLGKNNLVEPLGNYVFGLLFLGFVETVVHYFVYHKV